MPENVRHAKSDIGHLQYDLDSRVLHIHLFDWAEMSLESTAEHYRIINELTNNDEYYALINAENYFSFDDDAFKHTITKEALGKRRASAHYNSSVANKLNVQAYNALYLPPIPVKYFDSKEEAMKWIEELKDANPT